MKNFNPVRGTYDYMPNIASFRESVREIIIKNYQANGYNLITTPVLESLDFLNSSEGGDNLKLMFKTIKRGGKLDLTKPDLTESDLVEEGLRYDLTVPLARFYSCNRDKLPTPFKSIQIGCSYRAERPQRGRNREFVQCDIDVIGDSSINAELELLKTSLETYKKLGLNNLTVKINNRKILNSLVVYAGFKQEDVNTVCVTLDKLDKISINGVMMELIEKGFETENINKLVDILNEIVEKGLDGVLSFGVEEKDVAELKYLLSNLKILIPDANITFDISIVRGQGYYTGTVYEVYTDGFSGAIGGGGRYDNMVGKFSGINAPAVGISIGFEPVVMLLLEGGKKLTTKSNLALIYDLDDDIINVFNKKDELMKDYNVSLFIRPKNMKNFYEKIVEVADFVAVYKDLLQGKDIKQLEK